MPTDHSQGARGPPVGAVSRRRRSSPATKGRRPGPNHGNAAPAPAERSRVTRSQLRFGLSFVAAAGVLFFLYAFPYAGHGTAERWFQGYLSGYAHLAGGVLSIFDRQVSVSGSFIQGRFPLHIVKTCDAMEANILFLAAVVAFPARWKQRLLAASLGIAVLVLLNLIRICSLYFVGVYAPSAFDTIHLEIWPLVLILVAVAEFVVWTRWTTRTRVAPEAA